MNSAASNASNSGRSYLRARSAKAEQAAEASRLFTRALEKVESASIRSWACAQRRVWVKIILGGCGTLAGRPVFDCAENDRAASLAAFIVATAIGL